MKNKMFIISSLAGIMLAPSAFSADGQINFKGNIIDSACQVTNNMGNPLEVVLGDVARTAFSGKGATAAATQFTLALTKCPESVKTAAVKFDGVSVNGDSEVLALTTEAGVAEGVGIQLTDASQKVVPLYTASSPYTLNEGDNNLDFTARYIATEDTVKAGPANSTATFTIVYN
ncbi:fimbrial protein [Morganella morganii]